MTFQPKKKKKKGNPWDSQGFKKSRNYNTSQAFALEGNLKLGCFLRSLENGFVR